VIHQAALSVLFAVPLIAWSGVLTLASFAFTAYIGFTNHHQMKHRLPFIWHPTMVVVSFFFALLHTFFALSIYLGY